jgi:histidinol-phosphate aminotransferase
MLAEVSADFFSAYPEPFNLYRKLAAYHQADVNSILLTAGSEMAIRYLLEAYLDRGDGFLLLNPSFAMFEVYARLIGAEIQAIDYDKNFHVSADAVIERLTPQIKILAIANPNNPTGTVFSKSDLERMVRAAARNDTIFLLDEAYFYFYSETMLGRHSEFPNLVVTRTFSKACGIAGVRLGYAVGAPAIISEVAKLQPIDHVTNFAVKVGEYVLDHEKLIWDYAAKTNQGKDFLLQELRGMGLDCRDSHANFVLADFGQNQQKWTQKLRERGILIGANLRLSFDSGWVRITAGPIDQMRQFVDAIREIQQ